MGHAYLLEIRLNLEKPFLRRSALCNASKTFASIQRSATKGTRNVSRKHAKATP
ncbi:hypothetical protein RR42_m2633 [Cupriavidus basilensis]|uniref:Uncharacterized protein n=1 Tax=Cupriavidus basilensis TaxID=68895 RepID=A0A0C4YD19_9BURK|nr:hypothetical protein RR42_m2633 [Cupriavidus basilensis]